MRIEYSLVFFLLPGFAYSRRVLEPENNQELLQSSDNAEYMDVAWMVEYALWNTPEQKAEIHYEITTFMELNHFTRIEGEWIDCLKLHSLDRSARTLQRTAIDIICD